MLKEFSYQESNEKSVFCRRNALNKLTKNLFTLLMTAILLISSVQMPFFSVYAANPPAVPQNVKASSASYSSIKVSWSAVKSATGYVVYRYNSVKKSYDKLTMTKTTSYINTGLVTGKKYSYKTRSYTSVNGKNTYSNMSSAISAIPKLSTPTSFAAKIASSSSIKLEWSAVSGASGYSVYSLNLGTGSYKCIKNIKSTSFTDKGLSSGRHYYKIAAYIKVNDIKVYSASSPVKIVQLSIPTTIKQENTTLPSTIPSSPKFTTIEALENYLNSKYSVITTPIGDFSTDIWITKNTKNTSYTDLYIFSELTPNSFLLLDSLDTSLEITSSQKSDTISLLKNNQKNIYSVASASFPKYKMEGSLYYSWYDYPTINEGFHSLDCFSWENYKINYSSSKPAYYTSYLTEFHWTPDMDDYNL